MLLWTALGVGVLHTLLGPDHYLPFIVIGRARRWGLGRVSWLTFVCGLGHVGSSVAIGLLAVALGSALTSVQEVEAMRGEWAGWALIVFGAAYGSWGFAKALRGRTPHSHLHIHDDGDIHTHRHIHLPGNLHASVHAHPHAKATTPGDERIPWKNLTPWILFLVFVLGPCEPLIPLFFASALGGNYHEVLLVTVGYSVATLVTMHVIVTLSWFGLKNLSLGRAEKHSHTLAGVVVFLSGIGIVFAGL